MRKMTEDERRRRISVFTEILQALGEYSEKVDTGELSPDDYTEYQQLKARTIRAYKTGRFNNDEYRALLGVYHYIEAGARYVLEMDSPQAITQEGEQWKS